MIMREFSSLNDSVIPNGLFERNQSARRIRDQLHREITMAGLGGPGYQQREAARTRHRCNSLILSFKEMLFASCTLSEEGIRLHAPVPGRESLENSLPWTFSFCRFPRGLDFSC